MKTRNAWIVAALSLLLPSAALAEGGIAPAQFGPRIGISSSPDQLVVGGQMEFPEFAPHLTVDPNVELGVLDNRTTVSLDADFFYHFDVRNSVWAPYAGMGLGLTVTQFDSGLGHDSATDVGANLVLGASVPTRGGSRFLSELRLGLGDIPQLKIIAGWNFRM